jgi:heme exporter protein B
MLALVVMLANLGFSATGTLFSAITADSGRNEALLPILFYPVVTPLVSISVKVTGAIFSGAGTGEYSSWLYVMAGYGSVFTGLGYLLMAHVVME